MLRLAGRRRFLHQCEKSFLQNVLSFAVAQAQGATIKDQACGFRLVEVLKPFNVFNVVHAFEIWTPPPANLYKISAAGPIRPVA